MKRSSAAGSSRSPSMASTVKMLVLETPSTVTVAVPWKRPRVLSWSMTSQANWVALTLNSW
jgi:hypothetical protein